MLNIIVLIKTVAVCLASAYFLYRLVKFNKFYRDIGYIISIYSSMQAGNYHSRFLKELEEAIKAGEVSITDPVVFNQFNKKFSEINADRLKWGDFEENHSVVFGFYPKEKIKLFSLALRSFVHDDLVNEIIYDTISLKQMIEYIEGEKTRTAGK